jgi:DNA-binding PadR family transcriptional regulator
MLSEDIGRSDGWPSLREPTFLILLSLVEGEKHGYAIIKDVAALSHNAMVLSSGTLYEALARLLDQGWIDRVEEGANDEANGATARPGKPRKAYRLTLQGRRVVQAETVRLQALLTAAQRRLAPAVGT